MTDWPYYRRALEKLGFRQYAYKQAFGDVGSPANLALVDLAVYCGAFADEMMNLTHDQVMQMHGRRQAFFRIWKHLKLNQADMEVVMRGYLLRSAAQMEQGEN